MERSSALLRHASPHASLGAASSRVLTCAAPCSLSQKLREIPAAQSESNALYGLDPMHLSQLALRDATRAAAMLPKQPTAHLQQVGHVLSAVFQSVLPCTGRQVTHAVRRQNLTAPVLLLCACMPTVATSRPGHCAWAHAQACRSGGSVYCRGSVDSRPWSGLQGKSYALLEQYTRAEAAFMEGLAADPGHAELQQALRQLSQHLASSGPARSSSTPTSFRQACTCTCMDGCQICTGVPHRQASGFMGSAGAESRLPAVPACSFDMTQLVEAVCCCTSWRSCMPTCSMPMPPLLSSACHAGCLVWSTARTWTVSCASSCCMSL